MPESVEALTSSGSEEHNVCCCCNGHEARLWFFYVRWDGGYFWLQRRAPARRGRGDSQCEGLAGFSHIDRRTRRVACLAKSFPSAGCGRAPAGRAPCASSFDRLAIRDRKIGGVDSWRWESRQVWFERNKHRWCCSPSKFRQQCSNTSNKFCIQNHTSVEQHN